MYIPTIPTYRLPRSTLAAAIADSWRQFEASSTSLEKQLIDYPSQPSSCLQHPRYPRRGTYANAGRQRTCSGPEATTSPLLLPRCGRLDTMAQGADLQARTQHALSLCTHSSPTRHLVALTFLDWKNNQGPLEKLRGRVLATTRLKFHLSVCPARYS